MRCLATGKNLQNGEYTPKLKVPELLSEDAEFVSVAFRFLINALVFTSQTFEITVKRRHLLRKISLAATRSVTSVFCLPLLDRTAFI